MRGIVGYAKISILRVDIDTFLVNAKGKEDYEIKLPIGSSVTISAPHLIDIEGIYKEELDEGLY